MLKAGMALLPTHRLIFIIISDLKKNQTVGQRSYQATKEVSADMLIAHSLYKAYEKSRSISEQHPPNLNIAQKLIGSANLERNGVIELKPFIPN